MRPRKLALASLPSSGIRDRFQKRYIYCFQSSIEVLFLLLGYSLQIMLNSSYFQEISELTKFKQMLEQ